MQTTLFIISVVLLINTLFLLFKYCYALRLIKNRRTTSHNSYKNRFILLCPVYHEEINILRFYNQLKKLKYPTNKYDIYFITTEREKLTPAVGKNTIEILDALKMPNNFHIIHYPYTQGYKAEQLNYAYKNIIRNYKNIDSIFFALLDADSDVPQNYLHNINDQIVPNIQVYQQPVAWLRNFDQLSNFSLVKSFPLLQTYFSIAYEIPMIEQLFNHIRIRHFIGNGITIRGSVLKKFNGFPSLIEDTRFGRLCSFANISSRIIPYFGNVDSAPRLTILIKQLSVWFFGTSLFIKDYKSMKAIGVKHITCKNLAFIIYAIFKTFRWLNEGLAHLIIIIIALWANDTTILSIIICSLLLRTIIPSIMIVAYTNKIHIAKINILSAIIPIFLSPILYMIDWLGTYLGLMKIILYKLCGRITLYKTERS